MPPSESVAFELRCCVVDGRPAASGISADARLLGEQVALYPTEEESSKSFSVAGGDALQMLEPLLIKSSQQWQSGFAGRMLIWFDAALSGPIKAASALRRMLLAKELLGFAVGVKLQIEEPQGEVGGAAGDSGECCRGEEAQVLAIGRRGMSLPERFGWEQLSALDIAGASCGSFWWAAVLRSIQKVI